MHWSKKLFVTCSPVFERKDISNKYHFSHCPGTFPCIASIYIFVCFKCNLSRSSCLHNSLVNQILNQLSQNVQENTYSRHLVSGFWTLCSMFFPCPSWDSLYGYFPVLVKLIWLFLAPVLVLLDYILFVYKSLVLPESLSVRSSFYVVSPGWLYLDIELLKRRTFLYLLSLASFPHHTTVTDERTTKKDDFSWGRTVGFAAGRSEVGKVCGGVSRAFEPGELAQRCSRCVLPAGVGWREDKMRSSRGWFSPYRAN